MSTWHGQLGGKSYKATSEHAQMGFGPGFDFGLLASRRTPEFFWLDLVACGDSLTTSHLGMASFFHNFGEFGKAKAGKNAVPQAC